MRTGALALLFGLAACAGNRPNDPPYEPTPPAVVEIMLALAQPRAGELLADLGCGDGRIVIEAAKRYGARGLCVDIDPARIAEAEENARAAGVAERIRFVTRDLFEVDLREARVVTLFLSPTVNAALRPKLERELAPGARVVSHWFRMGDWKPERSETVKVGIRQRPVYLWTIP